MAVKFRRLMLVCGTALVSAMCGSNASPTAPSPVSSSPAPAPAPATPPVAVTAGKVAVTVAPNPVPFSGQPVSDVSGCANVKNTWFYEQVLREEAGTEVTFRNRVDRFDGFTVNNLTDVAIVVPANGSLTLRSRWCSATAAEHSAQSSFSGTDAHGNFVQVTGPLVRLMKP